MSKVRIALPIPFTTLDGRPPVKSFRALCRTAARITALMEQEGPMSPVVARAHLTFGAICHVSMLRLASAEHGTSLSPRDQADIRTVLAGVAMSMLDKDDRLAAGQSDSDADRAAEEARWNAVLGALGDLIDGDAASWEARWRTLVLRAEHRLNQSGIEL